MLIQKKRKRSSSNIQAQIVSQTYLHQQIKTKGEGEGPEKQQNNCTILPHWISIVPNVLSQRRYVCIVTSGARRTKSSSHPGASFLKDLQGQRWTKKTQRRGECTARLKVICKRQGHVESVTVRPRWLLPLGLALPARGAVHSPNVPPESSALNGSAKKRGKCLHKAGERKALSRGGSRGGQWRLSSWCRAVGQAASTLALEWHDAMCHVHSSLGGKSRADKEIARGKGENPAWAVAASISVKWPKFIQWLDHSEHFTLRDDIITALRRERNYSILNKLKQRGLGIFMDKIKWSIVLVTWSFRLLLDCSRKSIEISRSCISSIKSKFLQRGLKKLNPTFC